jgi:hypothetical protein
VPGSLGDRLLSSRLAEAIVQAKPDVVVPMQDDLLGPCVSAARVAGALVHRPPEAPVPADVDLVTVVPGRPELALPTAGLGQHHTPGHPMPAYVPEPGRHDGTQAVICYRKTAANPGRYIEAAMSRSGLDVRLETDHIDLGTVDPRAEFVLFVEGPHPTLDVTGTTEVPVMFWAHHGEHHLYPNIRLTDRYRADVVLLAHSWHLAHWFPAPVHRFPFAVAPELLDPRRPLEDRQFDIAMVGSKLRGQAWQYRDRQNLVETIETSFPADQVAFMEGISPEAMAALYGDSRVVLNEGGVRHHPITMRVFEAIGSGAALLTDEAPGLELLFDRDLDFRVMTGDVGDDVAALLGDLVTSQAMVDHALERARLSHTYDHRIDELMAIAGSTTKRDIPEPSTTDDLGRLIDRDIDVQRIVADEPDDLVLQLPDRQVWSLEERRDGRLDPGSMDAAVITTGAVAGNESLLGAARKYIYSMGPVDGMEDFLRRSHPDAVIKSIGGLQRIDLLAESYAVTPTNPSS